MGLVYVTDKLPFNLFVARISLAAAPQLSRFGCDDRSHTFSDTLGGGGSPLLRDSEAFVTVANIVLLAIEEVC